MTLDVRVGDVDVMRSVV